MILGFGSCIDNLEGQKSALKGMMAFKKWQPLCYGFC